MSENNEDLETKAGFLKRSRKAVVGAFVAFVGAFGPAFVVATGDGIITGQEVAAISVVSLGIAAAAFGAVYQVRNAPSA